MKFFCRVEHRSAECWSVVHVGHDPDIGPIEVTAATRERAMNKMRGELRCRIERCPSPGEAYSRLTIELETARPTNR